MKSDAQQQDGGAIASKDLFAVLSPVLDWYQSDGQPPREPLEILRDIVADLQSDRAAALAGAKDTRRLDFMDSHPLPTEVRGGCDDGHQGRAWAIAAHHGNLRDALDAWMLSANDQAERTAADRDFESPETKRINAGVELPGGAAVRSSAWLEHNV